MGCDIHCYMEYKHPNGDNWRGFGGRINPGRDYQMFGALAGVRSSDGPAVDPRGVPSDMGWRSDSDYWLHVNDEHADSDGWTSLDNARRWISSGDSVGSYDENGNLIRVSHPDWHTHSWLTPDEFELSIALFLKREGFSIGLPRLQDRESLEMAVPMESDRNILTGIAEYWAILQALRCFESQGLQARIVFWFDN